MTAADGLSDDELYARLTQRRVRDDHARFIVANREDYAIQDSIDHYLGAA